MFWTFEQVAFSLRLELPVGGAKARKECSRWREQQLQRTWLRRSSLGIRRSEQKPGERSGALVGGNLRGGSGRGSPEPGKRLGNTEDFEASVV